MKMDCPNPRGGGGGGGGGDRECFQCYQKGHSKNDCPNEKVLKCRNCDEIGHHSKECPKPRDYSRVQCNNCKQCKLQIYFPIHVHITSNTIQSVTPSFDARSLPPKRQLEAGTPQQIPPPALSMAPGAATMPWLQVVTGLTLLCLLLTSGVVMALSGRVAAIRTIKC